MMWTENSIFKNDLEKIAASKFIPWERLNGKTVFITGATGLIGFTLASGLLYYSKTRGASIRVLALARDVEKARNKFADQLADGCDLNFVHGDVEHLPSIEQPVEYIVHGASPTDSIFFVQKPVETILCNIQGTYNMLELARKKHVKSFAYLSSMEVYGANQNDEYIFEDSTTSVNSMSLRSSYPQAKLVCENLCVSYCNEYAVPAKVIRLAQTFGPGVPRDNMRVFAQFGRCVLNKTNIVLQTTGESSHTYLYTADAATAILSVLLCGKQGNAYNAANPATYCSIREMAEMLAQNMANGEISVEVQITDTSKYPPTHCLNLNADKLMKLGWYPTTDLPGMYRNMLQCF
ncbi:MAG: NAD(P)-dependent oxidoreductase [Desulfovibrio sp.]|nr:NAD(P)-dependent oxidoreductase [Desulfovibrio sp.]